MAPGVRTELIEGEGGPLVRKQAADGPGRRTLGGEAERLARARHPGVVTVVDHEPGRLTLAWAGSETLAVLRPAVTEAAAILAAVAATVADLHQVGLVHGRLDPTHVVLGPDRRPRLCGLRGPLPGEPPADPADDVAALGSLIDHLVGTDQELEPIPERRWPVRRWSGYQRRALLALADQARHEEPARRPTARALAAGIVAAVPDAASAPHPPPVAHRSPPPPGRPSKPRSRRRRPALVGAAGLALLLLAVNGALPGRHLQARATPDPSDRPSSTTAGRAPTPEPAAAPCAAVPGAEGSAGADIDGDGCAEAVRVAGTSIEADGVDYDIGQDGDEVAVGDWDCDGAATPALVRPATGEIFVFDGWAVPDGPVTVRPTDVVTGARRLRPPRSSEDCDPRVELADRTTRPLPSRGAGG